MQDIKRQLDALYCLRNFILDCRDHLLDSIQMYSNMVSRLKEVGISREIAENYEANYYTANIRLLLQIIESFSEVDIKYIDANIFALEQLLEEAVGTSKASKTVIFNKGIENIKRKMEDEQQTKGKQQDMLTQIIIDLKKNVPNERGCRNYDSELATAEEQQKNKNKILFDWFKQYQK